MVGLVLAALAPRAAAAPGPWGIDVTLSPTRAKPGQVVDFTVTLSNSGSLTVTVCRIDIKFVWDVVPANVFTGSEDIVVGGSRSWHAEEPIPASLARGNYSADVNVTAMTVVPPVCESNDWSIYPIEIVPNVPPIADFSFAPSNPAAGTIVYFTDKSTDPDGTIARWQWDFGDGTNSTVPSPVHAYASSGGFSVVLMVWDDSDGSDTATQTLPVLSNLPPLAGFSYGPPTNSTSMDIAFTDGSSDPDGQVVKWYWDFGDGTNSSERNPIHRFPDAGIYPVVLTVTDDHGASNSVTRKVVIAAPTSRGGEPQQTGFDALEWGLLSAVLGSTSVIAAILVRRKIRPHRRWGQAQNPPTPVEPQRRWRPR